MPKKKKTEGLVRRSNGSWQRAEWIGDKRRFFTAPTPDEVWQKVEAAKEQYREEQRAAQEEKDLGPLFEVIADEYLADITATRRHGTLKAYIPCIKRAREHFAGYRMREIEPWMIATFLRSPPLNIMAATTVSNQKTVINNIYQLWIDSPQWRGDVNPARETKMPRGLQRGKRLPPTEEQIQIVKAHADDPDALLPVAYLCTGERKGEMCALQLRDIDFEERVIHITKSVEYQGNAPVLRDYTKTPAGIRTIPLLQLLSSALQPYRKYPKSTYIIGLGPEPVTASKYRRMWERFWRKYNVAVPVQRTKRIHRRGRDERIAYTDWSVPVCGHQFRHEYVCLLAVADVPEEIAIQIVGHANAKMIHEVYMALKPGMIASAREKLDRLL